MKTKLQALLFVIFSLLNFTTNAQDTELWGMTSQGGDYNSGTIFKTDGNGENHSVEYSFFKYEGFNPQNTNLIKLSNGKLYGMTSSGGKNGSGVIFWYDSNTLSYQKIYDFEEINGGYPYGSLMEASNGLLYGMTRLGGINGFGTIFSFDPVNLVYTKLLDFDGVNGRSPYGSLMEASNGLLYGMTSLGGTNNMGVLFSYDFLTAIYTKHLDFDGTNNGRSPYRSLIETSNGLLYGMTTLGGANNMGVLFSYDFVAAIYTKHLDFDSTNNGRYPYGNLIETSNGLLYGTASSGGANNSGVLFSINPATSLYTKHLDFDGINSGSSPRASLIQATNGKLYGTTFSGGTNNLGTLFSFDIITNSFTKNLDLNSVDTGRNPLGGLLELSNGMMYGMVSSGGLVGNGTLFSFDPVNSIYLKQFDFGSSENGYLPFGSLIKASNGKLYGMTAEGGANNHGILFSIDPFSRTFIKQFDFNANTIGRNPYGNLLQASDGNLYGMTSAGGSNNLGTLFSYNPITRIYLKHFDFTGTANGRNPYGSLIESSNGKIYGITYRGGANNEGVLFEYDFINENFIKKQDFGGAVSTPQRVYGSLLEATDGNLYFISSTCTGCGSTGRFYKYDIVNNQITSLGNTLGSSTSSFIQHSNGKLYSYRGSGAKQIFEYDLSTNSSLGLFSFNGSYSGSNPRGTLLEASNGRLYGMTSFGGINDNGVIFEYDPISNVYTKKLDFNGLNGAEPVYTALLEVKKAVVWTTANEWSNVVGPTIDDVTIIEGDLAVGTDFGDFSAKSLTIRAGGSLVIESGHVVTVNAHITNLATEADFVVESGANLVQLKDFQNEGNATVKRESAPIVRLDYTAWGAPVEGQNLLDFSPQTLPNRFYTYDYTGTTTATAWIPVADPSTTNFEPSHGYLLRAPNNWSSSVYTPYQGEFIGKPNNGSFQNTVGVGYNLLGNPYPSPLSADAFLNANAALGVSSLYYWTHAVPQNGAYVPQTNYASYNLSGGTAAIAGGAQPDEFIQVGQGFLVNIATAGQAQFTNAQRSDSSNNQFFKTTTTDVDRFWLGLRNDNASYNQILVAYVNGATNGIDLGYDAKLLTNGNSHLSSLINNENYVIQGRNSVFEVNDEVPLSFTAEQSGMFTISLDAVEGIFDSQDILLWDKQLNIYHNLQTNDYSFTTNAGTFNNRFSVVYDSALNNQTFDSENNILIYKSNESLVISSNNIIIKNVKVYDIQGRLLVEKNDVNASSITVSEIKAKNQVLLVDIQTDNGSVTKKIGF